MLVITLGVVMIYAVVAIGNVIDALTLAYDLLTGSIFVPIMGAFFWARPTWQGAISSIGASGLVVLGTLWLEGFTSNLPIVYGLATSFVIFVGVSYLTRPPPTEVTERWREKVDRPRRSSELSRTRARMRESAKGRDGQVTATARTGAPSASASASGNA